MNVYIIELFKTLYLDASGHCQAGKPNAVISWSVQRDRTYKYTILQEKRIVQGMGCIQCMYLYYAIVE